MVKKYTLEDLKNGELTNFIEKIEGMISEVNLLKTKLEEINSVFKLIHPLIEKQLITNENEKKYRLSDEFIEFLNSINFNVPEHMTKKYFIKIITKYLNDNNLIENDFIKIDDKLKIIIPYKETIQSSDLLSEIKFCLISLKKYTIQKNTEKFLKAIEYPTENNLIEKNVLARIIIKYIYDNKLNDKNSFKLDSNLKLLFKKSFPLDEISKNIKDLIIKDN